MGRVIWFLILVFLLSIVPLTLAAFMNWVVEPDRMWDFWARPNLWEEGLQVLWCLISWQIVKSFTGYTPWIKEGA